MSKTKKITIRKLKFKDYPEFTPNMTPKQVLQNGSFGGTYFRDIYSSVTQKKYKGKKVIEEFPKNWFTGLDLEQKILSQNYDKKLNKYGVECGTSLDYWESKKWITEHDPYGWFQWYCRFYRGRRIPEEDRRQIDRWLNLTGPKGRFRNRLYGMITKKGGIEQIENYEISPKIRQTLQHWGYKVNEKDYNEFLENKK